MKTVLMSLLAMGLLGGALTGCENRSHDETVCLDTVHRIALAYEGCGYGYAPSREQLLDQLSQCEGVMAIRDEDALYDQCFPALEQASCVDLEAGIIPASCDAQILF